MEAVDAVLPTAQTKKQEIVMQLSPDLPQVWGWMLNDQESFVTC
jgi:hypothetical protein